MLLDKRTKARRSTVSMRLFFLFLFLFLLVLLGTLPACAQRTGYEPRGKNGPERPAPPPFQVDPVDPATEAGKVHHPAGGEALPGRDREEAADAADAIAGEAGTVPSGDDAGTVADTERAGERDEPAGSSQNDEEGGSPLESASGSVGRPASPRGPQGEDARLLYRVNLALDLLEAGAVLQADRIVDELTVLFPEKRSAELFQVFLRRRYPLLRETSKSERASMIRDPEAAAKAYAEGRKLLEKSKNREALLAFERAYSLDSQDPEIAESLVSLLKNTGLELYSKGEWSEAISYWRRALEIAPTDAETLRFISRAENIEKQM